VRTIDDLSAEIERRFVSFGSTPAEGMRVVDLPQQVKEGTLHLGVGRDGARLLVPFAKDAHRDFKPDRRSAALQLAVTTFEGNDGRRHYLDVVCTRPDLRWLFTSFVADMILRFARSPDVPAVAIVRKCFVAWRAMFVREGPRLSIKQLAGLFGELSVLERLLRKSDSATAVWKGPLGSPHDFVGAAQAVEVKTTLTSEDRVVHIHGIEQLAAPSRSGLALAHLRAEAPVSDGETVPRLVDRATALDATGRVASLLAGAGYFPHHAESYADLTFEVVVEEWFRVDDEFPRLSATSFPGGQVPAGLSDFRYSLDLGTVSAPPMGSDEVEAVMRELVS
jgi:hypothetical protein